MYIWLDEVNCVNDYMNLLFECNDFSVVIFYVKSVFCDMAEFFA